MGGTSAQMHRKGTIMAKKNNTFTEAQVQAIVAKAVAEALASVKKPTTSGKGKVKDTAFTKHDGTVVMTTAAQAAAWEKHRDSYTDRVGNKEANLKAWADKRDAYKPTKALKEAIKANRASITLAVAKEKYGFVGTKKDLQALKDTVCK